MVDDGVEVAVAGLPVGELVPGERVHVDVAGQQVVAGLDAVLGDVLEEEGPRDPLADRSPLQVREGDDDGVDVAGADHVRQGLEGQHPCTMAQFGANRPLVRRGAGPGRRPSRRPTAGWDTGSMTPPGARPLVGVTAYRQETRWWAWDRDAALVPGAYLDVVVAAGGWPVLLPPLGEGAGDDPDGAVAAVAGPLVDAVDALVVIGGGDVSAERYGAVPDPRNGGVNPYRDELEFGLARGRPRARPARAGRLPRDAGPQRAARRDPRPAAARPPRHDAPPAGPGGLRRGDGPHGAVDHRATPARRRDGRAVQPPPGRRRRWGSRCWCRPAATTG